MSELQPIWNNADLTGATLPPPFSIPNNPNAKSLKINNQSRYWLLLTKTQTNTNVDRIEPFSHLIIPYESDLSLSIDKMGSTSAPTSSLSPDHEFVDFSSIHGVIGYQKGSTQFSGASTVDINNAQVNMSANTVTVNNSGISTAISDASGSITTASISQIVLAQNSNRKYLLFQNVSDTDMYINFGAAATIGGSGSIWLAAYGGSIEYENMICPTDAIQVICSANGKAYTCKYV